MTLIPRMLAFAATAHAEQVDKNGQPYIWHPIRVAQGLRNAGYAETYQAVALGHDIVEDTVRAKKPVTLDQIGDLFGPTVRDGIDAMTRRGHLEPTYRWTGPGAPKPEWVWEETYKDYIHRCCGHLIGRKVKRYDVYDNADPRRYCAGVPTEKYIWTLDYLNSIEKDDVIAQWEGIHRGSR